jgi:branched-chain amino acid aminotransferase
VTNVCSINGQIEPETRARIPCLDRGFLFGDSIYEVIRTHDRVPYAFDAHLKRLRASADRLRLQLPFSEDELADQVRTTIRAADRLRRAEPDQPQGTEKYIRVIVSRGTGSMPNIDTVYVASPPNVVIFVRHLQPANDPAAAIRACIVQTLRNDRRALDPAIKSGNYLNNILGLMEAKQRGGGEAIFLNSSGLVTEASTSNVGIVKDGRAWTPPLDSGILAGVTRSVLLAAAKAAGVAFAERAFDLAELRAADEVFLTSTLRGVLPVTQLDDDRVGAGKPGPVTGQLQELLAVCVAREIAAVRSRWVE